jgi:FKBP-type peptidyl-prolyl cis-trans isomerase
MMRFGPGAVVIGVVLAGCSLLLLAGEPASAPAAPAAPAAGKTETRDNGLKITYVSPGSGAKDGDTVQVLYTGKLANGTEFDSSAKHGNEPIELVLGKKMVIPGWEEGLKGMQVGEKRTLVIPPALAYGPEGREPVIPANATLTFEVELVSLRRTPAAAGQ